VLPNSCYTGFIGKGDNALSFTTFTKQITTMKSSILLLPVVALLWTTCSPKATEQRIANAPGKGTPTLSDSHTTNSTNMYPPLALYIEEVLTEIPAIPEGRKNDLKEIATYVRGKRQQGQVAHLNFICTHNSRRSHMSQIWAATAAAYFGVDEGVKTYSGGTEATAFNPRAVAAIQRSGFEVEDPGGENPHYRVKYTESATAMTCFSKKYDDPHNPAKDFAAIMTCSQADASCPIIPGAALRVPIPYEDPKVADGTDHEAAQYDLRCRQIAAEMFFLMSQV
jgi:arsenate reductase